MVSAAPLAPNHHAHHPGFSGLTGVVGALSMIAGRGPQARLVADLARVGTGDRVVDVGCGPGRAAREAARRGALVVGVDPAAVMLRTARLFGRRSQLSWRSGTAEALPIDNGWATVVWSIATVHHWHDLDAGGREVLRALAPGGRLLAVERRAVADATGLASHGWTNDQAARFAVACEHLGYVDVEVLHELAARTQVLVVRAHSPA